MPSPLGHALGGVAGGCLVAALGRGGCRGRDATASPGTDHRDPRALAGLAGLGVLADADFLFGVHSAYTHSIGAMLVVAGTLGVIGHRRGLAGGWVFGVTAAAYGSHVLLDYLGTDTVAPHGVMALWPVSVDYYLSDLHLFRSVCRELWEVACWRHNARGAVRELVLLAPLVALAVWAPGRARGDDRRNGG